VINRQPTPTRKQVVPKLKLALNPEDKMREIRALSRQLQEAIVSESSLSSSN
jgi:hypothetical protein